MAKNPDPTLKLATSSGVVRTLDDWSTMFHLVLVILPDRPEAKNYIPVAKKIFSVFGDADCRAAFVIPSTEGIADRILGPLAESVMTFIDPDKELVRSLGLTQLPAFVHLRQDTTVAAAAEGWDAREWQRVANEVGKAMAWSVPDVTKAANLPKSGSFPVA